MASHGILPISRQNLTIDLPGCALALLVAVLPLILRGKSSRIAGVLLWLLYGGYLMCSF